MIPIKPANSFWSDEQWSAIWEKGQNILVNAGAGSGKTAVLTERIIRILKEGISLERLIVLTFTRAAAQEMKLRLRKRLEAEIKAGYNLQAALDYLDQASVQTFDSFALEIVRRYHYLLEVNRTITIGDNVLFSLRKKEIIAEVFEAFYEEEDQEFLNLVSLFSIKNDNNLQKFVYDVDRKLDLLPNKKVYLDEYLSRYYQPSFIQNKLRDYLELIKLEKKRIKMRLDRLKDEVSDENLILHVIECDDALASLLSAETYLEYKSAVELSLPRIPRKADEEEKAFVSNEKDEIKNSLKILKEYLIYPDEGYLFESILQTKPYSKTFIRILREVNQKFYAYKHQNNVYEFHDIAKMAIHLLEENEEIRNYLKENTYEILIDEYQDTSDLQEILISLISQNNVYMVGDLKQSIYRFRNANPEIFKNKYDSFKLKGQGLAIDLSYNFRSRKEVIEDINLIFSQIISERLGGVDYLGQELLFGNLKYEENQANDNYRMRLLNYDYDNEELKKEEIEAFLIGEDIKRLVKTHHIYDKNSGEIRKANYSDFVILASEKKHFDLYKKIFEFLGIPLLIHKDESFIQSPEIYVLKNILRALYSLQDQDYYLGNFKDAVLSILRSFLVEAPDEEIASLFNGDFMEGLKSRFPEVQEKLMKISRQAQKLTLSQILWEIYQSFDFYSKILKIGNIEEVEEKLNFLLLKFKELDMLGYRIYDAINYLEEIMEENLDLEFSSGNYEALAVQMMSIHKSKGLEFPICYYPELDSRFKFNELYDRVVFDQEYGIIFPIFNEGLEDIFYKKLLKHKYQIEEISERIRVLYVALTRAKEQLIIVSPKFKEKTRSKTLVLPLEDRLNYKSFFDIFSSIGSSLEGFLEFPKTDHFNKDYEKGKAIFGLDQRVGTPLEIKQISLQKEKEEKRIASTARVGLLDKRTLENIDLGNRFHEILEIVDFKEREKLDELLIPDFYKSRLKSLFNQEIFQNEILRVYHEYPFIHEGIHGVIDLIIENQEELIILDYKLSDISKIEYLSQLEIYKTYLDSISSKKVHAYLYSILKDELKKVF